MAKLRGLGRGLDALLGSNGEPAQGDALQTLSVELLQPGKYQPRSRMDTESLQELAESIRSQGVMQPILVRPVAAGAYEIIAGERRWRAARLAGLREIPAVVRHVGDEAALAMALIENIQREDLNPLEQALGVQRLVDEFQMTHQQAAEAIGRSRSAVTNLLRLTNLPAPVQELLMEGRIDMGHARALLALPAAKQIAAAQMVAARQLSVRETERMVKRGEQKTPAQRPKDQDVRRLEAGLSEWLGAATSIKSGQGKRGQLTIQYASLEQLEGILERIGYAELGD